MEEIKNQIKIARNERETGDPRKALEMFLNINQSDLSETQIYDYLGELGLTYFHLQDFENAKKNFEIALEKAKTEGKISYQALFLRHLTKKEFNSDPQVLVKLSTQARELAEKADRKDLIWFDQGVISSLLASNSNEEEIKKWFLIESKDLLEASREVKDETAIWVWVTGMLIEKYQFDKDLSHLNLALLISEKFNLERRIEQIKKLKN